LIRNLSRIGDRDLLRSGVRIYEWGLLGNYELDVLIEDATLADTMQEQFRRDMARSRGVARRPLRGPGRISQALPVALTRQEPEVTPEVYHRSGREIRRRAALVRDERLGPPDGPLGLRPGVVLANHFRKGFVAA
jgi:hypothetical protein